MPLREKTPARGDESSWKNLSRQREPSTHRALCLRAKKRWRRTTRQPLLKKRFSTARVVCSTLCRCAKKRSRRTTSTTSSAKAKLDSRGQRFLKKRFSAARAKKPSHRARSTTFIFYGSPWGARVSLKATFAAIGSPQSVRETLSMKDTDFRVDSSGRFARKNASAH